MLPYALTIFLAAFLLFQVQPLVAKSILPWFGGGPAVWTACMLFFQGALLAGYAYAHVSIRVLRPRMQGAIHLVLLAAALWQLPAVPPDSWKPSGVELPTWHILYLLTASLALPYLVLSSTTPLLQAWFSRAHTRRSPYRLFALSNFGSLLALVSYPFVFEPLLSRSRQSTLWSLGFVAFALACAACAVWTLRGHSAESDATPEVPTPSAPAPTPPTPLDRLLWLALATSAAVLFLAITNQITMDVAVVPFLWVLPLGIYLLTFVIAFDHHRWYVRRWFALALVPATSAAVWMMFRAHDASILEQLVTYSTVLFVGCMICHGELSRLRPHPRYLTGFYLRIALGGAFGGGFVALVAPLIFNDYLELHLALLAVVALTLVSLFRDRESTLHRGQPLWAWTALFASFVGLAMVLAAHSRIGVELAVERSRSFYGVLSVYRELPNTPEERLSLWHGRVGHGAQFVAAARRSLPAAYYAPSSGAAMAFRHWPGPGDRRIGMVGMGVGSLAAYARPGDYLRIYEINPQLTEMVGRHFTFLDDSPARIEVIMGDARLSMEREAPQRFDLLFLDAFNGDAIPLHLLTKEAFEIYLSHLQPDGVMALLISTWHLDFAPAVRRLADHFGLIAVRIDTPGLALNENWGSNWMLLTRNRRFLSRLAGEIATDADGLAIDPDLAVSNSGTAPANDGWLWTDDYTSLFPLLWK